MRPRITMRSFVLGALLSVITPAAANAQVIVGRVVDAASGAGIARATITADGPYSPRTLSGDDGRFSIQLGMVGSYRVRVTRAGYRDAAGGTVSVGPSDTVSVDVRVSADPVALSTLDVTARKRPLKVTGRFRPRRVGSAASAPVRAQGRWRSIGVRGTFVTPSVCYDLAAVADRTGQVVTLVVEARSGGRHCDVDPGAFTYSLGLGDLPPGTYTLRVFHTTRNRGEREMTADTTVMVR